MGVKDIVDVDLAYSRAMGVKDIVAVDLAYSRATGVKDIVAVDLADSRPISSTQFRTIELIVSHPALLFFNRGHFSIIVGAIASSPWPRLRPENACPRESGGA
jgi:hypothetical protein